MIMTNTTNDFEDSDDINLEIYKYVFLLIEDNMEDAQSECDRYLSTQNDTSIESRLKLLYSKWRDQMEETQSIIYNLYHLVKNSELLINSYIKKLEEIREILSKKNLENSEQFLNFIEKFNQTIEPFLNKLLVPYRLLNDETFIEKIISKNILEFINQLQKSSQKLSEFKSTIIELDNELSSKIKEIHSLDELIDKFKNYYT